MKRAILKRGKPLRRKTPMRRSTRASSYAQRSRDPEYMMLVRKLPCSVRTCVPRLMGDDQPLINPTPCGGRIEADHMGERAMGKKAPDDTCASMCSTHHRERTNLFGMFAGWTRPQMRQWCDYVITSTRHEITMMKRRMAT